MMNFSSARKNRFPCILNSVLNQGFDSIYWCEDFSSFAIKDEEKFTQLLPLYFKSKNLSAFKRNLNHYGFRKAPTRSVSSTHTASPASTKEVSVYYHTIFEKDNMPVLESMRVLSSAKKEIDDVTQGPEELMINVKIADAQKPRVDKEKETQQGVHVVSLAPEIHIPDIRCGFKSILSPMASGTSLDPCHQKCSPLGSKNDPQIRENSLNGHTSRNSFGALGSSMVLDRMSEVSLCGQELQLRSSHSQCSMADFSDGRWSNLSNPEGSPHPLAGIDLTPEAFLRDQESSSREIEDSILGINLDSILDFNR